MQLVCAVVLNLSTNMKDKLTSLTGFGEGDPKPEKKGAKAKALSAKMGKKVDHKESLLKAQKSASRGAKSGDDYFDKLHASKAFKAWRNS